MMTEEAYQQYLQSDQWKALRVQALERAGHKCQVCNNPDALDVHHRTYERIGHELLDDLTVLCESCHDLFHERTKRATSVVPLELALRDFYERVDERHQDDRAPSMSGFPTGFVDLDEKTAGLQNGELIVVAARAGNGKSAFLLNLARHIALDDHLPVLFVSLEHDRTGLAQRLLSAHARVDSQKIRTDHLSSKDLESLIKAGEILRSVKLFINDSPRQNMMYIVASARQVQQEQGFCA